MGKKKGVTISLIPRWVLEKDVLMGWVVVHRKHRNEIKLEHLKYAKITNMENNKSIICRISGPGTQGSYYDFFGSDLVKQSIFIDAYYRQKLNIESRKIGINSMKFRIRPIRFLAPLRASLQHPHAAVKAGTWLGIVSVSLGFLSILISVF